MIKSVSLHVTTTINGVLYLIGQLRGRLNFEHSPPKKESWAGGLQPLVHGKLKDGESVTDAVKRELSEETGLPVTALDSSFQNLRTIGDTEHFCLHLHESRLSEIRLHPSSGGLILLTETDLSQVANLKMLAKDEYVDVLAMFPDDLQMATVLLGR